MAQAQSQRGFGFTKFILSLSIFIFSFPSVWAQDIAFDELTSSDLEKIVDEMSANFAFTSVSGASSLGRLYGFEIGIIAGMTQTPEVEKLAKEQDPGADAEQIPHGMIFAALTVPFGITVEGGLIPEIGSDDVKFKTMGLAGKWTITDLFFSDLPVTLAARAHITQTKLSFEQVLDNASTGGPKDVNIAFDNTVIGTQLIASKNLGIVEPYVGIGFLQADGTLDAEGSYTIFGTGGTAKDKKSSSASGTQFLLGAELKLIFFKAGLEYSNHLGTDRLSGKLAFYF